MRERSGRSGFEFRADDEEKPSKIPITEKLLSERRLSLLWMGKKQPLKVLFKESHLHEKSAVFIKAEDLTIDMRRQERGMIPEDLTVSEVVVLEGYKDDEDERVKRDKGEYIRCRKCLGSGQVDSSQGVSTMVLLAGNLEADPKHGHKWKTLKRYSKAQFDM